MRRNAVNEYYTKAQQDRAKRQRQDDTTGLGGLEDYRMGADDHWWTANILLSQVRIITTHYVIRNLVVTRKFMFKRAASQEEPLNQVTY